VHLWLIGYADMLLAKGILEWLSFVANRLCFPKIDFMLEFVGIF
jgi:hypothetical protein